MISFIKVIIPKHIIEYVEKFLLQKKFEKQIQKLRLGILDKGLGFEKIHCKSGVYFFSFRIDIHYRAYLRKENETFIVFDVNKHDYQIIKKKLKNM